MKELPAAAGLTTGTPLDPETRVSSTNPVEPDLFFRASTGFTLLLCLAAAVCTALAEVSMFRDGSYYFLKMWNTGEPLIAHARIASQIIEAPLLAVTSLFQNFELSRGCFNATYASIPFLALFACWLVTRKTQPAMMVWPVVALLASVPCRPDGISENNIASVLAWPALFCLVQTPTKLTASATLVIAGMMAFLHPSSIPFLLILSIAAFSLYRKGDGQKNLRKVLAYGLVGLWLFKLVCFIAFPQPYESGLFNESALRNLIECGLAVPCIATLVPALFAALLLLLMTTKRVENKVITGTTIVLLLATGVAGIYWSASVQFWHQCFWYQKVFLFPNMLLLLFAFIDNRRQLGKPLSTGFYKSRALIFNMAGLLFACAIMVQANSWANLSGEFKRSINENNQPIIERSQIRGINETPLDHWSACSYGIVLQAKYPCKYVLDSEEAKIARATNEFRLTPWDRSFTGNYFRLPPR